MVYFGFDLGDGESCLHYTLDSTQGIVNLAPISGYGSFLSALALVNGETVVGQNVKSVEGEADNVYVCFKRHFLQNDPENEVVIVNFVRGVLAELRKNTTVGKYVDDAENACFIVGCPAGWSASDRERYRGLMQQAGMKNVRIASESRAAFENVLNGGTEGVDEALARKTVLMVDIGSSTLDFAYVRDGYEFGIDTTGNTLLGGGLMDEMIVLHSLELQEKTAPDEVKAIRGIIESNVGKKGKLMLAVRQIKEDYFNNEDHYLETNTGIEKTVYLFGQGKSHKVNLQISPSIVEEWLISRPHPLLKGQSFESRLRDSLLQVYDDIQNDPKKQKQPDLVVLTGGPSRMHFFQDLCKKQFSASTIVISDEPEYDIARGLVQIGIVDERMRGCLDEIEQFVKSSQIEDLITAAVPELIEALKDPLANAMMDNCVAPAFEEWRSGQLKTLNDFKTASEEKLKEYSHSSTMQEAMQEAIKPWSRKIFDSVAEVINEIARKHRTELRIEGGVLKVRGGGPDEPIDIKINFLETIENIVTNVITVVLPVLAVILLELGVVGAILAGVVGVIVAVIGGDAAKSLVMSTNLPKFIRKKTKPENVMSQENRDKIREAVAKSMQENDQLSEDLTRQVSEDIRRTMVKAAKDIENAMAN